MCDDGDDGDDFCMLYECNASFRLETADDKLAAWNTQGMGASIFTMGGTASSSPVKELIMRNARIYDDSRTQPVCAFWINSIG
jgi:hypothetical protein